MTISPDLPDVCYTFMPQAGGVCAIKKGQRGYYLVKDYPNYTQELVDRLNERLGVTKAQEMAMVSGSMQGWHIPAADPKTWEKAATDGPTRKHARSRP